MVRRISLLCEDTHRRQMDISRRFGATSWDCLSLEDGTDRFNRCVYIYYIATQRNIPGEGRFDINRGGSLKSFIMLRNHNRYLIGHWTTVVTVQVTVLSKSFGL